MVERIAHAEGAGKLAGMDGDAEAGVAGNVEGAGEIGDAVHALLAGEIEASDQRMRPARGILRRLHNPLRAEMANADDEKARLDTGLGPRALGSFGKAAHVGIRPDAHGEHLRFSWTLGPAGAEDLMQGTDFVEFADGKLARVTGFLDKVPVGA